MFRHSLQVSKHCFRSRWETLSDVKKHFRQRGGILLAIYNKVYFQAEFSRIWYNATVLFFLKLNEAPDVRESYRSISPTSCVCKVLEKMINFRLQYVVESLDVWTYEQHGFRKMRGTEDNHARLQTAIPDAFAQRHHLVAIFFDLRKAYDITWRHSFLHNIYTLRIRGLLAHFIRRFLGRRYFKTQIVSCLSEEHIQKERVPQGCVLSCTLFILAINDVRDTPRDVHSSLYVDNLEIYIAGSYLPSITRRLQLAITHIYRWTTGHVSYISHDKTVGVHFHRRRQLYPNPTLTLTHGQRIKFEPQCKFLGIIYDQHLNWRSHIDSLKRKYTKVMNSLKTLSSELWGWSANIIKDLPSSYLIKNWFWLPILCVFEWEGSWKIRPGSQYGTEDLCPSV